MTKYKDLKRKISQICKCKTVKFVTSATAALEIVFLWGLLFLGMACFFVEKSH